MGILHPTQSSALSSSHCHVCAPQVLAFSKLHALSCWLYFVPASKWVRLSWVRASVGRTGWAGSHLTDSIPYQECKLHPVSVLGFYWQWCPSTWFVSSSGLSSSQGEASRLPYSERSQISRPGLACLQTSPCYFPLQVLPRSLTGTGVVWLTSGSHSTIMCFWC